MSEENSVELNQNMRFRIVTLNADGFPDAKETPTLGDMYLTPSRTCEDQYDEWIWAGSVLKWQRIGEIASFDEERTLRAERVENVRNYFKTRKRARIAV